MMLSRALLALALVSPLLPASADTVSVPASADAVIYSPLAGDTFAYANGAGDYLHAGVNGGNGGNRVLRSLLRFDLAGSIPPGATVTQVVLRLTSYKHSGSLLLRRVNRAWSEGPADGGGGEGIGVPAATGDVTWNHAIHTNTPWTVAGGDISSATSASVSSALTGALAFSSPGLVSDVQSMLGNPSGNHGWMLVNADQATPANSIQLASRTNPVTADRPVLEVSYSPQTRPALYYDFSEGSGTTVTNRGYLGGAGVLNGAGGDERWVSGPAGGALELDGEDLPNGDRIHTGITAATLGLNGSTYTAAAWINFTKAPGDNMVFGQISATSNVLHLGVRNSRTHLGHWANDVTGATPLSTGVWYHVVWEYREGYQRIFLNGNLDTGPAARGLLPAATELIIGRSGPGGWGFRGRIDEVVVYTQALNLAQIRHLAAGGDPLALPANEVANNPTFHTAPFGPGGTWNLYQFRGTLADRPRTWVDAENQAVASVDPSGLTTQPGHLADVTQRQENFFLERIAGFQNVWVGLTDNEAYGAAEAGTNRAGNWKWTSGAAYSYQNWSAGEPSNGGTSGEDGVHLYAGTGLWNDQVNGIAPQTTGAPLYVYVVEWQTASPNPVPGAQVIAPILPTPLAGRGPANAGFGVRAVSNNGTFDNIVRAVASVQSGLGTIVEGKVTTINATDPQVPGAVGSVPGDVPFLGDTAADDNYIIHVYKGRLVVTNAAAYTLVFRTDDGGALRLPGRTWTTVFGTGTTDIASPDTLYRERGTGELRGVVTLAAGQHDIELLAYEQTGGASHEFYAVPGSFDEDTDSPAWRLVGQPARTVPVPGIRLVNGTNWLVRTSAPGGNAAITNLNNLANAELELSADPNVVSASHDFINFSDPQGAGAPPGSFTGDAPFDNGTAGADEDFALEATGTLEIPETGLYQFGFRGDDGGSLRIAGQTWNAPLAFAVNGSSVINGDTIQHNVNTGNSHTRGNILLAAGSYPIRVLYWERSGGANFEVFGDNALNVQPDLLRGGGGRLVVDKPALDLAVVEPIQADAPVYNPGAGTVSVSWNSMPGASYRVEWSVNYTNWTPLLSGVASQGATTTIQVTDSFGSPFVVFRILEE